MKRDNLLRLNIIILLALFVTTFLLPLKSNADIHEKVPDVPANTIAPIDPLFHKSLAQGIELTFHDRYEKCIVIFDSLIMIHPNHPAPYFFKAAAYQNLMSVYRVADYQKELEENIQKAIEAGNKLLETSDDPWLNFYIGAAYGYRAFNRFRQHNWIGAYRDGTKGIDNFKKALEKDSTLYDVYLGLGSYHYWRTAKSKFIRIIAFWMSDKRELGLRQLHFAIDHGRYAHYEASYVLIAAYFDAGEFTKAQQVLNNLLKLKETRTLTDLYYQNRLHEKFGNWQSVESYSRNILETIKKSPHLSIGYQVECMYWIAKSLSIQGNYIEAHKTARSALLLSRKRNKEKEMEGHLEKFDDIRDKLEELLQEIQAKAGD